MIADVSNRAANHRRASGVRRRILSGVAATINTHGFVIIAVGTGDCAIAGCACSESDGRRQWVYTVGLTDRGLPELVMEGPLPADAHDLVAGVAAQLGAGLAPPSVRVGGARLQLLPRDAAWVLVNADRLGVWFEHFRSRRQAPTLPRMIEVRLIGGSAAMMDG